MKQFLLFQLYGPMAAWGDMAVGEQRPSAGQPSKSAIMGLLAAAEGVRRDEEAIHREMTAGYGFGVRVDAPGELLRDYHTAQVPPAKGRATFFTRRDELRNAELNTILSSRDYRTDSRYTVVVWVRETVAPFTLEALADALRRPRLVPYLGRKACPPAVPMCPQVLEADNLKSAFAAAAFPDDGLLSRIEWPGQVSYYWEALDGDAAGMPASMVYPRRDQSLSRQRWQFAERDEFYYSESTQKVQG
jgi:CRISPR system Cascade subunit CasD